MNHALITIGMIVHNGEKHIAAAIDSLLQQTCNDFALIIFDNASTDRTNQIATEHARRDSRVRVIRHSSNIGVVNNLLAASACVATPFFCWASHDDVRDPCFFRAMIDLMAQHPEADLACCAVHNMDPDGTIRNIRPETASLQSTDGMSAPDRLIMYLREAPGTPFYGLFGTRALATARAVLCDSVRNFPAGEPQLGVDMLVLANVLRSHGMAVTLQPLLHFRRGGQSHSLNTFGTLSNLARHIWRFHRELGRTTQVTNASTYDRIRLGMARWRFMIRYLCGNDMRRMIWHYVVQRMPNIHHAASWWAARTDPALRALRRRFKAHPDLKRIVLMGAGKHTRRRHHAIRMATRGLAHIVGACDDSADHCAPLGIIPIVPTARCAELRPDVILVSSDTYESQLFHRAREIAESTIEVWCIYDRALEANASPCSRSSTAARNSLDSTKASTRSPAMVDERSPAFTR